MRQRGKAPGVKNQPDCLGGRDGFLWRTVFPAMLQIFFKCLLHRGDIAGLHQRPGKMRPCDDGQRSAFCQGVLRNHEAVFLEKGEHFHIAVIAILSKLRQRPYQLRGMMVNEEADYMDFFSLIYT